MTLIKGQDITQFSKTIVVRDKSQLSGQLDSTTQYFIDGVIDITGQSIEIPQGGLTLKGYNFDLSGLVSADDNYTMFTSPASGSGNLLGSDYYITTSGVNSKVYDIKSATGFEAFEFQRVNYNDCTSLGVIDNYRQGLEEGTGRFGGTPTIELKGEWLGGYRVTTSITRSLDDAMNAPLFKAGTGFVMQNRFLTDMNVDLGATASLFDFSEVNFPTASTLQVLGAIVSRNGVFDANDSTITPNITAANLSSIWKNNIGLDNTFVGGRLTLTTEAETVITVIGDEYDILGTYTTSELEHFDSPANGQLRHLGSTPRDYNVILDLVVDGNQNTELEVIIKKWDDSASAFVTAGKQRRTVNALAGGRDVAFFTLITPVKLDKDDYIKLMIKNNSSTANVTLELDSFMTIAEQ